MVNSEIAKKYPKIYEGDFAIVHDLSSDYPGLAYGFWCGFFALDNKSFIHDMNETSLKIVKEYGIKIFISDHSMLRVVTQDVLDWLSEHWYQNAFESGLRFELSLNAKSTIANMSLKKMLDNRHTKGVTTVEVPSIDDGIHLASEYLQSMQ